MDSSVYEVNAYRKVNRNSIPDRGRIILCGFGLHPVLSNGYEEFFSRMKSERSKAEETNNVHLVSMLRTYLTPPTPYFNSDKYGFFY
jgi:hypothetical protein